MTHELHRHDARKISELLAPESVDLIVTSPPYFALRSYRDMSRVVHPDGTVEEMRIHYPGQLGSEASPSEFVDALIECTADWLKVLKPTGSIFVNLGDKRAGSGGHNNSNVSRWGTAPLQGGDRTLIQRDANVAEQIAATRRNAPDRYNQTSDGIKAKSLMGLPWRYAIRCIDELGLILRADIIWNKPNGLPESVTDRVRSSHEYLFHFTRQGRYFAAIDEVREPQTQPERSGTWNGSPTGGRATPDVEGNNWQGWQGRQLAFNPLGKVPGSVWTIPSEPLQVPPELGVDHFAAFPSELPRRCILGWTPTGWCTACGEARRPIVDRQQVKSPVHGDGSIVGNRNGGPDERGWDGLPRFNVDATITGYACACTPYTDHPENAGSSWHNHDRDAEAGHNQDGAARKARYNAEQANPRPPTREYHFDDWTPAPTTPSVVLDPFAGTGTTVAVATLLGRHGIGTDLSNDYLRLAEWRCTSDQRLKDKVLDRSGIPNPDPPAIDGQLDLFAEGI